MISPKQDIVITPTQAQGTSEKETENVRTGGKGKVYGTVLWAWLNCCTLALSAAVTNSTRPTRDWTANLPSWGGRDSWGPAPLWAIGDSSWLPGGGKDIFLSGIATRKSPLTYVPLTALIDLVDHHKSCPERKVIISRTYKSHKPQQWQQGIQAEKI